MAFLDWTDKYALKIRALDDDHRRMFRLINALHDAMTAGATRAVAASIFAELAATTQAHFREEEGLFELHEYPNLAAHRAEHRLLQQQLANLEGRFRRGDTGLTPAFLNSLKAWCTNHVLVSDSRGAAYLASRGVR